MSADLVTRLRAEFDRSFAEPARIEDRAFEHLLTVRVAGEPYALRLTEIAAVHVDRTVVRVPSSAPDLLGITGFRGTIVPIYDLGALLGYPAADAPRWIALTGERQTVGLAFDELEAQLRAHREDIVATVGGEPSHVRSAVRLAGSVRPLIHVASLLDLIAGRSRPAERAPKEQ